MELKQVQDSSLYKPCLRDEQQQRFDQSAELMNIDQCQTIGDMDDSQLVGAPANVAAGCDHVAAAGENGLPVKVEVKLAEKTVEKRRRGRPPRGQVKTTPVRKKTDEEDVCFICFDGGSLVLCDRRGCPKAYHPSCIKRDEAFFRSKAKWNCGWHICISCQKASHYMCYTCTFSLCKGCTKDTDYLCVRGNKGFCGTCMRTVMLIENLQGSTEMAKVDFDDKSSWEYLFKMYWIFLKGKLSLTLDELIKAKNPWKPPPAITSKGESSGEFYDGSNKTSFVSDNSYAAPKAICLKGKTTTKKGISKEDCLGNGKLGGYTVAHFSGDTNWASKELLEFVAYMKNGDISVLSQFDVQVLLLEYIKKNNLRDPSQKCQILCDSRLLNLFGKACVGHFEMLKLLESHFLIKEGSGADTTIQVGGMDAIARQVESDWSYDNQIMAVNDKRRKTRRRVDERRQQSNPVAYAAIDVYNINLIYLRRDLIVNLIEDVDKFHDKVVGSIVRIRISSCDQKPDMHRLVQVVGTSKVMEPYKIGTKTTDVMLEILNLDKKEVISIDGISNLEFDQDECERLHQSIKCGFIKRLTVGEIQQKAKVLQAVKVNDWLEAEVLKLNHLRDRASEKGHRKELRECVEKLQLLNSPEERQRRLQEVPVVHSDPNMDPNCESEDNGGELNEKKRGSQDNKVKPRNSGFGRKRREPASPRKGADLLVNSGNKAQKLLTASEQNRDKEAFGINVCNTANDQADPSDPVINGWSNQAVVGSGTFTGVASESTGLLLSTGTNLSVNDFETDRIWHYQDPTGKIQGPFNMLQLRKWGTSGLFPSDLKIWRINEKQDNSILLTDALTLQSYHEPLLRFNSHLPSRRVEAASDNQCNGGDAGSNKSMNAIPMDGKRVEESINLEQDNPSKHVDDDNEPVRSIGWGSLSSSCTTLPDVVNSNEEHTGIFSQGWDSLKGNNPWPNQPQLQVCSSLPPLVFPQKQNTSPQIREGHESERTSDQNNGNLNACPTADGQTSNGQGYENRSDSEGHSGQSSTQNWRPPPVNSPSHGWDSNSCFTSVAKSLETSEKNRKEIDFPDFPSPTPKQRNGDLEGQPAENKQSASSNAPVQDVGVSWSTASSLVGGGAQLHEVAGEWGGYSSTPAKPPVEEWDSSLVSVSSLKPNEMASDHAGTPASMSEQLTHSSPSHPASNTSSWQAIVDEPNEFSSLVDESVSDLLAEVEAMESLNGLASSTIISSGGELIEGSKNDCVSSVEGFSPAPDPGKGDALSSTGDIHLPRQSTMTDEPLKVDKADVLDPQNRSNGHSPTSVEQEGDAKHSDVSVNQLGCEAPSTASWDVSTVDTHHWNARSESMDTSWGAVQGNAGIDWSGLDQGNAVMRWGTTQGTTQESSNMNSGTSTPTGNFWGSQPRYGGERFFGPRDRVFQGRDSGYGRGRHAWNRQQFGGGGSGGGPYRPPPKGQRICKFYESGYCKKGASCSYLHP